MKAKLEKAEEKLNEYAASKQIIFLGYDRDDQGRMGEGKNITTKKLEDISNELTEATSDRIQKEMIYKELIAGQPESSSYVMSNPTIQELRSELAKLDAEYHNNLTVYKPKYPKMVRIKSQIDVLKKRIDAETKDQISRARKDYQTAAKREQFFKSAFENQKNEALDLNLRSIQYTILKREVETNRELYNNLLQRMKEIGISANIVASNIQLIDWAEIPKSPFKPNKKRNIMLSIIFGLFGGIGLAFFTEYLDNTVKTPEDIEKRMHMPSLGLVPHYSPAKGKIPIELISYSKSKNPINEAFTSIRTFLLFSSAGKPPKVIVITSPRKEEGKTTTILNMAISLTKSNSKVLIVDADMRRPRLHKIFKTSNKSGLSAFLSGNAELDTESLINNTPIKHLNIMTSGPLPPNPTELLSSFRMRELIDGLSPIYDFILFDSPPILGMADAAITSAHTDGVIMVVRSGQTPREAAQQAKKILEGLNSKLLGVVLNAISESNLKYGYYSYYQYYYGSDAKK
jgi:capsular exopolysaccharide synthesis family protein